MISIKLNLGALTCVRRKEKSAKTGEMMDCLILPIELNSLFVGEKGGVYLDLVAFEIDPSKRNANSKDTHLIKVSLPEEKRKAMTEEQKNAQPIVGNLVVWDGKAEIAAQVLPPDVNDMPF